MQGPIDLSPRELLLLQQAKEDGTETSIHIETYHKFVFSITFQTGNAKWIIDVGGDAPSIYQLDPYGGWDEWDAAGILRINKLSEALPCQTVLNLPKNIWRNPGRS